MNAFNVDPISGVLGDPRRLEIFYQRAGTALSDLLLLEMRDLTRRIQELLESGKIDRDARSDMLQKRWDALHARRKCILESISLPVEFDSDGIPHLLHHLRPSEECISPPTREKTVGDMMHDPEFMERVRKRRDKAMAKVRRERLAREKNDSGAR